MMGRWQPIVFGLSIATSIQLCADVADSKALKSSLKIDDRQLSELTVADVAKNLQTIAYAEDGDSYNGVEAEAELDGANYNEKELEFRRRIAKLERSLTVLRDRYRRLVRDLQSRQREYRPEAVGENRYPPSAVYVLDTESELGLVVLGFGSDEGMRPGLIYRVARRGRVVARLRLVLVRERISCAKVLEEGLEVFPGIGDEAVLGRPVK